MGKDEFFMRRAIFLAGSFDPSPNPKVGAVIVKNGEIIAEGFHKKAGMEHAEIEALGKLEKGKATGKFGRGKANAALGKGIANGSALYVTLEPCSHYGRTPPCTKAIINAGVKRVVYAVPDPTRKVRGKEELERAGIDVKEGVLRKEAEKLNPAFLKLARTGMPFVTLKSAMSLDGKISYGDGKGKKISGKEAHRYSHSLRAKNDAMLVGIGTVLKDDPRLTTRLVKGGNPLRIVLDSCLRIPLDAKVIGTDGKLVIATCAGCDAGKKKELERLGARVFEFGGERVGRKGAGASGFAGQEVPLKWLLKKLGSLGISSLLIEGGANVNGSFVKEMLVDKFCFFVSPKIIGKGKDVFGGKAGNVGLEIEKVERVGKDLLIIAVQIKMAAI